MEGKKDEKNVFDFYLNKYTYIRLKSGRYYFGKVIEVADIGNGLIFITIIDKYNSHIVFSSNELEVIEEERTERIQKEEVKKSGKQKSLAG